MARNVVEIVIRAKDQASAELKGVSGNIGSLAPIAAKAAVGIATAMAAAVTATVALANSAAKTGDEVAKMAKRTGASTEFLSQMGFAAERSGSSLAEFENGLRIAQRRLNDADSGLAEAKRTFDELGIGIKNSRGQLKSVEELLPEAAEAIARMTDESKQAALAQELFGRSGTKLLPLLKEGSAGIQKLREEAHRYGITINAEAGRESEEFRDSVTNLQASLQGLKLTVAQEIIPLLTPLANGIADVVVQTIEWVRQNKGIFKTFGEILGLAERTEIEKLEGRIKELIEEIDNLGDSADRAAIGLEGMFDAGSDLAEKQAELNRLMARLAALTGAAPDAITKETEAIERQSAAERKLAEVKKTKIQQKKAPETGRGTEPEPERKLPVGTKEALPTAAETFERQIFAQQRLAQIKKQLIQLGLQQKDVETGLAGLTVSQAEDVLAAETKKFEERGALHASFLETFSAGVAKELEGHMNLVQASSEMVAGLIEQTAEQFGDAFAQMIVYGEDFGEAFKGILKKVLAEIIAFVVAQIAKWAALTAAKALAGIPPGTPDAGLEAAIQVGGGPGGGGGGGLIRGIGRILGFQHGGVVTRPTVGLLGEGGPEAVIPIDRLLEALRQPVGVNATFNGPISSNVDIERAGEALGLGWERGRLRALMVS